MLAVMKKAFEKNAIKKDKQNKSIFVEKIEYTTEYKDNETIIKKVVKPINLTKKINETAKTIKIDQAQERYEEITRAIEELNN